MRLPLLMALIVPAALLPFAGCSGGSIGQSSAILPATFMNPSVGDANTPLVYLSIPGEVLVYDQRGHDQKPIRKLTKDIVFPGGMWVDTHGNLWVANTVSDYQSTILRFPPGAAKPDLSLADPGWQAYSVWVARDGAVYVVNAPFYASYTNFQVVEYPPRQKTPKSIGDPNLPFLTGAIVGDAHGNLFVGGIPTGSSAGEIDELKKGSSQWLKTISGITPYSLGFDAGGNLVVTTCCSYILTYPPGKTKPSNKITCTANCTSFAFNHRGTILWVVEANDRSGTTAELRYPSGHVIDSLPFQGSVATSPDLYP